jgi:glycosyltransferase involved in cell wall biosynthesis
LKALRVLYLHFVGPFGGSSRSLYEAISNFPSGSVEALFVTQRGSVRGFFKRVGEVVETVGLSQFDNTRYSYYRGVRWLVLLRELAYLPFTVQALAKARRRWPHVDLIHVNEFTGLVALWIAKRFFAAPAVVHVRSVPRLDSSSLRTRWVNRMLREEAQGVVAIDDSVRAGLPADLDVQVIHNGFSPRELSDAAAPAGLERLRADSFKVGFVGNLIRVKGIYELVEAARITRDMGLDVEFIAVGDDARPSRGIKHRLLKALGLHQNVRAEIEAEIDKLGLRDRFYLIGFTPDLARVYSCMNALAFPSHYDAPGRPIFEAAFFGVPSIVAVQNPRPDTLLDGKTGIAVSPRSPVELASAIERLVLDRNLTRRMGDAARQLAEQNFDAKENAKQLLNVYRRLVGQPSLTE